MRVVKAYSFPPELLGAAMAYQAQNKTKYPNMSILICRALAEKIKFKGKDDD